MRITLTAFCFALMAGGALTHVAWDAHATAQTRTARRGAPAGGKSDAGWKLKADARAKSEGADATKYPLSDEQRRAIRSILTKSKLAGVPLALMGAQGAKEFDENVLSEKPDAEADKRAGKKLSDGLAALAALRLQTIRDVVALLTPEQKQLLRAEMSKPGAPSALLEVLARVFNLPEE
jgi:Spy/CpxP family protein refolding chaperone